MRFAGMRVENFLNPNKPDFGEVANQGMANRSAERNAATALASQVSQAGVTAAAKVEAAKLVGAAQSEQASASTFASGLGMIANKRKSKKPHPRGGGSRPRGGIGASQTGGGSGNMDVTTPTWKQASKEANSFFGANI